MKTSDRLEVLDLLKEKLKIVLIDEYIACGGISNHTIGLVLDGEVIDRVLIKC